MIPWEFLDSAQVPGNGEELRLYRRGREFSIRVNGCELMNSRAHGSEEAVAELAARILQVEQRAYDAILMDVDNGPRGLTRKGNDWLYARAGLDAVFAALRPAGVLAVWSAGPDRAFTKHLCQAGFEVNEGCVRARCSGAGGQHTIWLAVRGS